jgi:hypothetical protein
MAHFKDTSQQGWIHDLAKGEIHPDAEKALQLGSSFDPRMLVEESTIEFLTELRESFNEFTKMFNSFAEGGAKFQEIKIYNIAQTAADFMLFRNQIKLIISNSGHGIVQLSYAQHVRSSVAVDGQGQTAQTALAPTQDIMAKVGPFRDIFWTYKDEKITAEQIAKFYFTEFCRMTRDTRKSKTSNQLLLNQIKALLQEKGIDL